jgi:predicted nucleotidyltransferase
VFPEPCREGESKNKGMCWARSVGAGKEKAERKAVVGRRAEQMRLAMALKEALVDAYDPEAIILFGSLGRGDADEFSDVDLLIVMETNRDVMDLGEEMAGDLNHLAKDKHLIVGTPESFRREMDIPGTIVFSATRDGQILFEKPDWGRQQAPTDPYAIRKKEVLRQEYAGSAHGFFAQAQASLGEGNVFRCRDFARFAVARAVKGLFVKHDMHSPRETDLDQLLDKAIQLEPDLVRHKALMGELNAYSPGKPDSGEKRRCLGLLERTSRFVDEILAKYDLD